MTAEPSPSTKPPRHHLSGAEVRSGEVQRSREWEEAEHDTASDHLVRAVLAWEQGRFGDVRDACARVLREPDAHPETRRHAEELLARLRPDPWNGLVLAAASVLILIVGYAAIV